MFVFYCPKLAAHAPVHIARKFDKRDLFIGPSVRFMFVYDEAWSKSTALSHRFMVSIYLFTYFAGVIKY